MINKSTPSRTTIFILRGGLIALLLAGLVVTTIEARHYRGLHNCTIFDPKTISTEYAKKQYTSAMTESEMEFRLKALAARTSLLFSTLVELDPNNEAFSETQFTNGLLYCDWIIYGDPDVKASNYMEGKCIIMNNAIDLINTNIEDINVFIYSLGNNKISYKYIWKGFNDDVHALNELIKDYNKANRTEYVTIHELKPIGEK